MAEVVLLTFSQSVVCIARPNLCVFWGFGGLFLLGLIFGFWGGGWVGVGCFHTH